MPGTLIISLDFELFWGVRDVVTLDGYGANLRGTRQAIPAILSLFANHVGAWILGRSFSNATDPGIDTGAIIGQALIAPEVADNFATYPLLQAAAGLPLLTDAIKAVLSGTLQLKPPPEGTSRLWSPSEARPVPDSHAAERNAVIR